MATRVRAGSKAPRRKPSTRGVYLDGLLLPVDAGNVRFKGLFAKHDLKRQPHATCKTAEGIGRALDGDYWMARELPNRDS